ncbi:MAG: APC family permease [Firmicutes bacterium]|nr:APC family permease [Bacillota bacterium]
METENKLKRKYGFVMAVCMIVGVVIGSGIFFRNEDVIRAVQGNLFMGLGAWIVGGLIMLAFAYTFAVLATRHEKMSGMTDYADAMVGKRYGYFLSWFMALFYIPAITAVMAWVSARFTVELFGWNASPVFSGQTMMLAGVYLIAIYVMNALGPKLAARFHVSTTVIKLIPLLLMGVVGLIVGLARGTIGSNYGATLPDMGYVANPFFLALVATAFAYDGWWVITSMNSEIKNSRRNMPMAMIVGGIIIIAVYAIYFIGIYSSGNIADLARAGGVMGAFTGIFGSAAGTVLFVFIVISCLGTLNGVTMAGQRAFYALAIRKKGPGQELFIQVDKKTNVPHNSALMSLLVAVIALMLFGGNFAGWYGWAPGDGPMPVDLPGFAPITFWAFLVPILIGMMIKQRDLNFFNRFIAPGAAIAGCIFMIYAAVDIHRLNVVWYLLAFGVIMGIGALFLLKKDRAEDAVAAEEMVVEEAAE